MIFLSRAGGEWGEEVPLVAPLASALTRSTHDHVVEVVTISSGVLCLECENWFPKARAMRDSQWRGFTKRKGNGGGDRRADSEPPARQFDGPAFFRELVFLGGWSG